MIAQIRDKSVFEAISSHDARAYMIAQGWEIKETLQNKALILSRAGTEEELLLPLRKELGDYALRMSELVNKLSEIENSSALSIISDINTNSADVIRIRIIEGAKDGSISLATTSEIIHEAKDMFLAAACAAHQPKKVYGHRKPDEAMHYLDKVRVGQTERGSYILTFISPVSPNLTSNLPDKDEIDYDPFDRMTTKVLAKSLLALKNAASSITNSLEAFEKEIVNGVSANLCLAISNILEKAGSTEISIKWANTRPKPKILLDNSITFDREMGPIIAEAARNFKLSEPQLEISVSGWVHNLKKESSTDPEGTIKLNVAIDRKLKSLKVILSKEDYNKAIAAHKESKAISLDGDLYREGRSYELRNPRNLMVIDIE